MVVFYHWLRYNHAMVRKQQSTGGGRKASAAPRPRWTWLDGEHIVLIAGLLFGAFSIYFIVCGFVFLHEESLLETEGRPATATVLEMKAHSHRFYSPTLRYADATDRQHVVECSFSTLNYCEGQRVSIVYLPAEPEILRVEDDRMSPGWQNVLCGAIFLLIWGGCAALGFYAIRKKHRKKRRFLRKM